MNLLRLLLIQALFWLTMASAADVPNPEFMVKSWRNEDGLPHSTINSILQTRDGYLWIGTYVGLVRFDGQRFTQYSSINVPDLETGEIIQLFEDRQGTLWVALLNGRLLAWNEDSVRVFLPGGATNPPVISMAQQTDGTIWLETANGSLGRITTNGVDFVSTSTRPTDRQIQGLVVDARDQLWVDTDQGLKLWRGQGLTSPNLPLLEGKQIEGLTRARDGAVWVYCNRTLWKVRPGQVLKQIKGPGELSGVAGFLEASDGRFWIGSVEGTLSVLNPGGAWQEISQAGFLGLNRLLYEDREGNLWRGGFGGGLTRIRPRIFNVHVLPSVSLDKYARTVSADPAGNVWAVLNDQIVSRIAAGTQDPVAWPGTIVSNTRTLLVDHYGYLWGDAPGAQLCRLENGVLVPKVSLGRDVISINALFEDADDNLWVGCTGGAGVIVLPKHDPAQWHALPGLSYPDVRTIAQATDKSMWFGTHYGGAFHWQNGIWTQLTTRDGLPSDYIRCFYVDPDGTLWLGTLRGLCRWRNGRLAAINSEQGLWNDSISDMIADARGNFWFSSFGGIFRVPCEDLNKCADGRSKSIQCVGYDFNDGLPSVECPGGFQPAGARTPDDRLWFPIVGGVVSVDPNHLHENTLPPPVWIETVVVDDKTYPLNHSTAALKLGPGKQQFNFRFTAPSFTSPEKVLFRHKLDGLDADWSPPAPERTVIYSHIPPGSYTFRVSACNNDAVWNTAGQSLKLIVLPFFWQTWWFKLAVVLALAIGLAWAVSWRVQWQARVRFEKLERERSVERERSRIAKDIHDDLGANLTQIVFLSQRVEGASRNPAEVEHWVRMIPAAASRTIRSLDEIVWAVNPRHDSLESLANYLSQFAQEFFMLAGLRCLLDVPTVLPAVPLPAEVRHNLVLTAREAMQNIVTHAHATEVRVSLLLDETCLKIIIADNGAGFDRSRVSGAGNGLANMQKRLEDIGGSLELNSRIGSGASVQFVLPRSRL